jgi:glycosyltransferase involved in cell wall biosynthesis
VRVQLRPQRYPLWKRAWRKSLTRKSDWNLEITKFFSRVNPELVVLSQGGILPPIEVIEICHAQSLRFVTIGQAASEYLWLDDQIAARYREVLPAALRCFFVSKANLALAQKQIGAELSNAEVVRNPFNVNYNCAPPWPSSDNPAELRLACVGRLDVGPKGQDLLLEALAAPGWIKRPWRLTLYGHGRTKNIIERMVKQLRLGERVTLAGHVTCVEDIWARNHVLVMPSRFEGLPLAIVEAMMCGRPVVATDVAGHAEIVEDDVTGFLADAPTVFSLTKALERLWTSRPDLKKMGEAAAKSIRLKVPPDPVRVFSRTLERLLVNHG